MHFQNSQTKVVNNNYAFYYTKSKRQKLKLYKRKQPLIPFENNTNYKTHPFSIISAIYFHYILIFSTSRSRLEQSTRWMSLAPWRNRCISCESENIILRQKKQQQQHRKYYQSDEDTFIMESMHAVAARHQSICQWKYECHWSDNLNLRVESTKFSLGKLTWFIEWIHRCHFKLKIMIKQWLKTARSQIVSTKIQKK